MKKVTINFILSMVFVVGLAITIAGYLNKQSVINDYTEQVATDIDELKNGQDEIDDVTGYALILKNIGKGLGVFGSFIMTLFAAAIGLYAIILLIFALIARAVYKPQGGRLIAYRILMTIEYILQSFIPITLGSTVVELFNLPGIGIKQIFSFSNISLLLVTLVSAACIIYSAVNTYTSRIKQA